MSNGVIELFTPEGDVKDYKLFSARLPQFLAAYPKDQGYRVKVETTDPMAHKPGLLKLYEAAITAGKNPTDVGLPVIAQGNTVVFTASLLDKDGNVLETASALRVILQYKDWEKGETAARQRLAAALGFGGECFDADEKSDIEDQGMSTGTAAPHPQSSEAKQPAAKQESTPKAGKPEAEEAKAPAPAESKDEQNTAPAVESSESDQPPAPTDAASGDSSQEGGQTEEIPARIVRQIQHQAKLKGVVDIPPYNTVKEAKLVLKDLMTR
jgi:hypothetical protein